MDNIRVTKTKYKILGGREGFLVVQGPKGCGVITPTGLEVVEPRYDDVEITPGQGPVEGFVCKTPGGADLRDLRGLLIRRYLGETCGGMREGVIVVKEAHGIRCEDKHGQPLFSLRGDHLASPSYSALFREGRLRVCNKSGYEYYYVNLLGEKKTAAHTNAGDYHDGRVVVSKEKLLHFRGYPYGVMDKAGKWVVRPKYDYIGIYHKGLAPVKRRGKMGVLDTKGKLVVPLEWTSVSGYNDEGTAFARREQPRMVCLIDRSGKPVLTLPHDCEYAWEFSEDRMAARAGDKRGYIGRNGAWVIPPRYEYALDFSCGVAPVREGDRWKFIDKQGRSVLEVDGRLQVIGKGLAVTEDTIYDYSVTPDYALLDMPLGKAIGAPRHDSYFRNPAVLSSIRIMAEDAMDKGVGHVLRQEYPDADKKSIIVNIIGGKLYVVDGNRHLVALLAADDTLTVNRLNDLRPRAVRVWRAGVEAGKNNPGSRYEVYIPVEADISRVPGGHLGTDWFKSPPAPTNIIPGDFPVDSELLAPEDRGVPLAHTVGWVLTEIYK